MSGSLLLLLLGVGVATGVTTVLFGFGGGFVTVPAVYAAAAAAGGAAAMHTAVATSTAVMIVNASTATVAGARRGLLRTAYLWPITVFITLGAAVGALGATWASEHLLHILFVGYLGLTIVDSIARRGFLGRPAADTPAPLRGYESTFGGIGIGAVASFLGVGGSVLTVPLLRRKGISMASATAMANPLSIPVAVAGSIVYAVAVPGTGHLGEVGHINTTAAVVLLAGSLPTIAISRRILAGVSIPDRVHAIAYVILLGVVMIAMTLTV